MNLALVRRRRREPLRRLRNPLCRLRSLFDGEQILLRADVKPVAVEVEAAAQMLEPRFRPPRRASDPAQDLGRAGFIRHVKVGTGRDQARDYRPARFEPEPLLINHVPFGRFDHCQHAILGDGVEQTVHEQRRGEVVFGCQLQLPQRRGCRLLAVDAQPNGPGLCLNEIRHIAHDERRRTVDAGRDFFAEHLAVR